MNGLNIPEMEASNMLDVLHYLFEEDFRYSGYEEAKYKDEMRKHLYSNMYERTYDYVQTSPDVDDDDYTGDNISDLKELPEASEPEEEVINPFNPRAKNLKPFVPATELDESSATPFGSILDEPMS